jgi:glycosyltransferase involved in cell wall biosynthesis
MHLLRYGGVQKMFVNITDGLERRGKVGNIACLVFDGPKRIENFKSDIKIVRLGLPVFDSYILTTLMRVREFPSFLWTMYKEKPDIVYPYQGPIDQLMALVSGKLLGKKVIARKYGEEHLENTLNQLINRISYHICDRIVTNFPEGKKELIAMKVSPQKIVYIPDGKEIKDYGSRLGKKEAKNRIGLDENDFVIGTVSRMDSVKNHEAIIRVLPEILIERKNAKFVIVGDAPKVSAYRKKLANLVAELGLEKNIIFTGYRNDVADVLAAFDIFVHPSFSEGAPGSVLEAMCAGLPIIASDVGGTKHLLKGDCGVLIPPNDLQKLSDALRDFMKNQKLRKEYGERAKKRIEKEFSHGAMLRHYEKFFTSF